MTSEVAILNRSGVAIAADSAVTIGGERVWMSSNKLFSLGPVHDIAIMVYGAGDFLGFPWELIIKEFRNHALTKPFGKVSDAWACFHDFLKEKRWFSEEATVIANAHLIADRLEYLLEGLEFEDDKSLESVIKNESTRLIDHIKNRDVTFSHLKIEEFRTEFGGQIAAFLEEISEIKPTKVACAAAENYLFEYYVRRLCTSGYQTGVVFIGYGSEEIYPHVLEYTYDGRLGDDLRFWAARELHVTDEYKNSGSIITFAQSDMTALFMEGISPAYVSFFNNAIAGILKRKTDDFVEAFVKDKDERIVERAIQNKQNKEIVTKLGERFKRMRQLEVINPLVSSIRALPRDEMTAMAEAFVELTSMRRKVDSNVQSVGGPVDVAFISKADGFVWIKRKLYFDPKENGDFFDRRALKRKVIP